MLVSGSQVSTANHENPLFPCTPPSMVIIGFSKWASSRNINYLYYPNVRK